MKKIGLFDTIVTRFARIDPMKLLGRPVTVRPGNLTSLWTDEEYSGDNHSDVYTRIVIIFINTENCNFSTAATLRRTRQGPRENHKKVRTIVIINAGEVCTLWMPEGGGEGVFSRPRSIRAILICTHRFVSRQIRTFENRFKNAAVRLRWIFRPYRFITTVTGGKRSKTVRERKKCTSRKFPAKPKVHWTVCHVYGGKCRPCSRWQFLRSEF